MESIERFRRATTAGPKRLAIIAAASVVVGCLGSTDPPAVQPNRRALVVGTVTDPTGPVANVRVWVQPIQNTAAIPPNAEQNTLASGEFRIEFFELSRSSRWLLFADPPVSAGLRGAQIEFAPLWFNGTPTDSIQFNVQLTP